MDTDKPFVGDQSPKIQLDASTPHGIRQAGLSLVNGKKYTGRIYLRGTPGTKVNVSLVWGSGDNDEQTITFAALTNEYKKLPLSFTSKADTSEAALEITGTGSGNFHIGTVSLMPADNVQGFRPDTIADAEEAPLRHVAPARRQLPLRLGLVRRHRRSSTSVRPCLTTPGTPCRSNDVGMDEFMTFCKLIDVDPYVTVNAGLGDSHSAMEEVEYLNGPATSYMGAKRAKNGHPEPYHIKYWNIGNEPWGDFQIGYTDLKYYVIKNNEFAKAMRKADPTITLIGSAKMLEPMCAERRRPRQIRRQPGSHVRHRHRLDRRPSVQKLGNIRRHRPALVRRSRTSLRLDQQSKLLPRCAHADGLRHLRPHHPRICALCRRCDPPSRRRVGRLPKALPADGRQKDLPLHRRVLLRRWWWRWPWRSQSQIRPGLRNALRRDDAAHQTSSPWVRTPWAHHRSTSLPPHPRSTPSASSTSSMASISRAPFLSRFPATRRSRPPEIHPISMSQRQAPVARPIRSTCSPLSRPTTSS